MLSTPTYSSGRRSLFNTVDWLLVIIYIVLVLTGWINIYASIQSEDISSIFDWGSRSGKQFIWILTALGLGSVILFVIPPKAYDSISPILYAVTILLLIAVIFVGPAHKGSHSWFTIGPVSFQPAEISKIATSLMLASFMSRGSFRMRGRDFAIVAGIILLPMLIIICEKETGSALVYVGFIFMMYREGFSGWFIAILGIVILEFILTIIFSPFIGIMVVLCLVALFDCAQAGAVKWWFLIAVPLIVLDFLIPQQGYRTLAICAEAGIYAGYSLWRSIRGVRQRFRLMSIAVLVGCILLSLSAGYIFNNVLKDYQKGRIEVLLGMKEDIHGVGYNVYQSKIAIGSGGLTGKGFCKGTQTAYGFVPEQTTDFIFCTVGEEWGFLGCSAVILLYALLIARIIRDSERSRETFTRVYGYCTAGCIFMHLFINIGMTLGLMPVIGIPLPFMSYGGSSLWAFTIMLFIFVALIKNEKKYF